MKILVSLLIFASAVQAHATATYTFGREVTTTSGCHLLWSFETLGSNNIGSVTWTGGCVAGAAEGYGVVSESGTSNLYFTKFEKGKSLRYIAMKNGAPVPFEITADSNDGTFITYESCKISVPCKSLLQRYNEMKPKMGSGSTDKGNSSGSSKASKSSAPSVSGHYGAITPPPHSSLRGIQGDRVACTDAVLGAKADEIANRLMARMNQPSLCPANLAGIEFFYRVITMIEKSCTVEQIPNVADLDEYRRGLDTSLGIVRETCTQAY